MRLCGKLISAMGAYSLPFTGFTTNPPAEKADPTKTQKILRYSNSTLLVYLTSQI
jgi:hypothetical protein